MTTKLSATHIQQLRKRVMEIGQHERRSVEEKIELGDIVISLQRMRKDVDMTGRK